MPRWTREQYEAFCHRDTATRAQPERSVRNEPLATPQGKEGDPVRFQVRIVSHRSRLLDYDNLCPKYFVDCLRYAGIIPNDRPQDIELIVKQEKCEKGYECTVIEVTPL